MKDCKFCDKDGLLILPLRYAAVTGNDIGDPRLGLLPAMPSTLGENVNDIAVSGAKYAPRMLRLGYLYVLIKRSGLLYWEGYLILNNAYLYKFPIDLPPPSSVAFSCDPGSCGIDASMISIPKVESVEKIYLLYTPSPMTARKLNEQKADPEGSQPGNYKMQTFDPKQWVDGGNQQKHSIKPEQLSSTVPEFILFKQCATHLTSELGKLMTEQLFRMTPAAFDGVPAPGSDSPPPARLGALELKMTRKKAAVFVLFDHIGITQELNEFRNDAYKIVEDFMAKTEKNISNAYRFDVHNAIGKMRIALQHEAIVRAQRAVEESDLSRRARLGGEPIFPDDTDKVRRTKILMNNSSKFPSRAEWEAKNADRVTQFENAREEDNQRLMNQARENEKATWEQKYAPEIDSGAIKRFSDLLNNAGETARNKAGARALQHMRWLQSKRVLNAFDLYDSTFVPSGEALVAHVVGCIFGMEGTPKAEAVLTEWATATSIKRENLLLRAFTRNQDAVMKAADDAFQKVTRLVSDMDELSPMPSTSWLRAIKGLGSAMKSTDSALDEWMRSQGQHEHYLNPRHIANVEGRFFYLISTITRSVARKGMGSKLEIAVVVRIDALMHSCMHGLVDELDYDTLHLKPDPEKAKDLRKRHAEATKLEKATERGLTGEQRRLHRTALSIKIAVELATVDLIRDAQLKAKLQLSWAAMRLGWRDLQNQLEASAQEHSNYKSMLNTLEKDDRFTRRAAQIPSPTNNYHQMRIGGALAGIECIALVTKLHSMWKEDGWGVAEAEFSASLLSLGSILLDMMYAYTKSVRERPPCSIVPIAEQSADITRGAFKLSSGLLAAFAGSITAFIDFNRLKTEKDPIQAIICTARGLAGVGSTYYGAKAAFSYSSPLLTRLAARQGSEFLKDKLEKLALEAFAISSRVRLLRIVAWFGWIGVAITVVDFGYAGYRWYMDSTALERWLSRCVFRKNRSNYRYRDLQEELKELAKAQDPGQEVD